MIHFVVRAKENLMAWRN